MRCKWVKMKGWREEFSLIINNKQLIDVIFCRFLNKSRSFSEEPVEMLEDTALEVVRNKRAKQQLAESKVSSKLI